MKANTAAPMVLVVVLLGALATVGAFNDDWKGLLGYLLGVAVALWLLIGLALPLEYAWGFDRVRFLGQISLGLGVLAFPAVALSQMMYGPETPRTAWIESIGVGIGFLMSLLAIVLVLRGLWLGRVRRRPEPAKEQAQRSLIGGTLLGSTAFLLLQLAIAYDLGEILP